MKVHRECHQARNLNVSHPFLLNRVELLVRRLPKNHIVDRYWCEIGGTTVSCRASFGSFISAGSLSVFGGFHWSIRCYNDNTFTPLCVVLSFLSLSRSLSHRLCDILIQPYNRYLVPFIIIESQQWGEYSNWNFTVTRNVSSISTTTKQH